LNNREKMSLTLKFVSDHKHVDLQIDCKKSFSDVTLNSRRAVDINHAWFARPPAAPSRRIVL
jgi:hypothetical protein